jgi:hypothetical protein
MDRDQEMNPRHVRSSAFRRLGSFAKGTTNAVAGVGFSIWFAHLINNDLPLPISNENQKRGIVMKSPMKMWIVFTLLFGATVSFAYAQQTRGSSVQTSVDTDNYTWMMNHRDDGHELRIRIKGKAEFNDDYSDIRTLSPGGSVRIEQTIGSVNKRYEIESDSGGNLRRSYFQQGKALEFDGEARRWLAALMLQAVRQSGYDAPRRVARLYQQGGAGAVLEEVAQIMGDYGKRVYLRELLANHSLDAAAAQRVVRMAAREIKSDYEKRQTLMPVAEKYLGNEQTLTEFVAAIATIKSDYERGQALAAALKGGSLTTAQLSGVLQSAAQISSDYEKAQALIRVAEQYPAEAAALPAFFDATNTIKSDYEHSRVLLVLLSGKPNTGNPNTGKPTAETLKLALKSTSGIGSDYEKARVLLQVAAIGKDDQVIREALVEAARNIHSDYERGRVLSAAFK